MNMFIYRLSNLLLRYNPARLAPAVLINEWARRLPEKGTVAKELMILDGRHNLHEAIPLGGFPVIGEIGVFKGDFAKFLKSKYRPSQLHLFDLFRQAQLMGSGDVDGNNCESCSGDFLFENAMRMFGSDPSIVFHEGDSKVTLAEMPDDYFDLIYIDGDHSYKGCLSDLTTSFRKIKNQGWIAGHDFAVNYKKCRHRWHFGVRDAVTDFCKDNNQKISALFLDGCVSYAIRIKK
jgi:hypothetical protein